MAPTTTDNVLLAFAAIVFALYLFWKLRPAMGVDDALELRRRADDALAKNLAGLQDDGARVTMLCEEGERLALAVGRRRRAAILFARAMRLAPADPKVIERASKALAKKPRLLEALLWKRLAYAQTTPVEKPALEATLAALAGAYAKMPRRSMRHRAVQNLLAVYKKS
jgi:hypothetical protein